MYFFLNLSFQLVLGIRFIQKSHTDMTMVLIINHWMRNQEILTLKEPGFLDPSHSRGGGADSAPPKISETDWRNIKCVVLVDSYDPPESIGTKKSTNIPCMTPQWRHKWRHVKNTKITKNRQNHGFSLFFQAKVAFLAMMCFKVCLHMFLLQINQINKIKHSESVSWNKKTKNKKHDLCAISIENQFLVSFSLDPALYYATPCHNPRSDF